MLANERLQLERLPFGLAAMFPSESVNTLNFAGKQGFWCLSHVARRNRSLSAHNLLPHAGAEG